MVIWVICLENTYTFLVQSVRLSKDSKCEGYGDSSVVGNMLSMAL